MRKGQAVVVVILSIAVLITIGLSVASRSTIEISVSTTQDESARALEAAEAGVEKALGGLIAAGHSDVQTFGSMNAQVYTTNTTSGGGSVYELPYKMEVGDVATINLNGYTNGSIQLCFGNGTGTNPAIEVEVYYNDGGVGVAKVGVDSISRANGFETSNNNNGNCGGLAGFPYKHRLTLTGPVGMFSGSPLFMRVRMLYNSTSQPLAINSTGGPSQIPTQTSDIVATGQSGLATQKLHVIQIDPDLPSVFGAAVFSGTSLIK